MTDDEIQRFINNLGARPASPTISAMWKRTETCLLELVEARRLLRGWLNTGGNVGSDWYDMTKALLDEPDGD